MTALNFLISNPIIMAGLIITLIAILILYRFYIRKWKDTLSTPKEKKYSFEKMWLSFWKYIRIPNSQTGKPDSLLTVAFYITFALMTKYLLAGMEIAINGTSFILGSASETVTVSLITLIWSSYFGKRWIDLKHNGNGNGVNSSNPEYDIAAKLFKIIEMKFEDEKQKNYARRQELAGIGETQPTPKKCSCVNELIPLEEDVDEHFVEMVKLKMKVEGHSDEEIEERVKKLRT